MKIYVSGPISGRPEGNVDSFTAAQVYLEGKGHKVVNPWMLNHDHDQSWGQFMRVDLKALLDCDGIFLLEGWEDSEGARIEAYVAMALKLYIRFQNPFLPRIVR